MLLITVLGHLIWCGADKEKVEAAEVTAAGGLSAAWDVSGAPFAVLGIAFALTGMWGVWRTNGSRTPLCLSLSVMICMTVHCASFSGPASENMAYF